MYSDLTYNTIMAHGSDIETPARTLDGAPRGMLSWFKSKKGSQGQINNTNHSIDSMNSETRPAGF